jgi:hypothetical protein
MVVAAGLGASAIEYQTDIGFRRGELFVTCAIAMRAAAPPAAAAPPPP